MKRGVILLSVIPILLFISSSVSRDSALPRDGSGETRNPYDSIRTDLSDYIWPTDGGRKMTSTFAEYRRTHFHGGVDIGTGSTTGYRVFAMRDGYVSRISVSPTGYGKMLFVRHPDGYYSTYAHLERFNAEIDARVAREQNALEHYPVTIECEPQEFPVRKGDIIAYTGETGVGSPHLHFELRDENLNFVNPLLCEQVNVNDNIPPQIRRVAITPLGEHAIIEGEWNPRVLSAKAAGRARYSVRETIQLTGRSGFAIDARDLSNGSNFRHGVYSHELFIDDSLIFTIRLDRAPSAEAHQIGLYYDWDLLHSGRGRFEKLYMNSPNNLPFYSPKSPDAGVINTADFSEGPHNFRIVTMDFNNNSSEVSGKLIFNHPPEFSIITGTSEFTMHFNELKKVEKVLLYSKKNGTGAWNLKTVYPDPDRTTNTIALPTPEGKYDVLKAVAENHLGTRSIPQIQFFKKPTGPAGSAKLTHTIERDFIRVRATTNQVFTSSPIVVVYEGESRRTFTLTPVDIDEYVGTFRPIETFHGMRRLVLQAEVNGQEASANAEFDLYPIVAGQSGSFEVDNGNLHIAYEPNSVFKTIYMQIKKQGGGEELSYSLLPDNIVLDKGITASVTVDPSRHKVGLFANLLGSEELLATKSDLSSTVLTGRVTRTLGELFLDEDVSPPHISQLNITRTSGGRPRIQFRYGDNFSGVDYNELKMYIDGVIAVPEIDGEHRRASYQVTDPLEHGSHQLVIRIKDRMGNSSEVERRFTVR
ncbi:MAG: M23 family metallopeptidase [Bacteroidota bacterium]